MKYSLQELDFIKNQVAQRYKLRHVAHACNHKFHDNRPIRTEKSIEFAVQAKLQLAKRRFTRSCEVCQSQFNTSWPQARYCSKSCKDVIDREYANRVYRLDPAKNVQHQTLRVRLRMDKRWSIILAYFGNKCAACGNTYPRIVYDLHHPNGKTSRNETPSKVIRGGTDTQFQKMLNETVLLCANCHRLEHAKTGNWAPNRKDQ